jgi:cytochrome c2
VSGEKQGVARGAADHAGGAGARAAVDRALRLRGVSRHSGIEGATSTAGPSLQGIADRKLIAGKFENQPETMMKWLRDPKLYDPQSGMQNVGITEKESRDIAAYLYTLK